MPSSLILFLCFALSLVQWQVLDKIANHIQRGYQLLDNDHYQAWDNPDHEPQVWYFTHTHKIPGRWDYATPGSPFYPEAPACYVVRQYLAQEHHHCAGY